MFSSMYKQLTNFNRTYWFQKRLAAFLNTSLMCKTPNYESSSHSNQRLKINGFKNINQLNISILISPLSHLTLWFILLSQTTKTKNQLYLLCVSVVHTLRDPAELPGPATLDCSSAVLRAQPDMPLPAAEWPPQLRPPAGNTRLRSVDACYRPSRSATHFSAPRCLLSAISLLMVGLTDTYRINSRHNLSMVCLAGIFEYSIMTIASSLLETILVYR